MIEDTLFTKMTINGLWSFLDSKHPAVREVVPQDSFRGYRIAVDAFNVFYVHRAVVRKRLVYSRDILSDPLNEGDILIPWLVEILGKLSEWMRRGITPILVYDGESPQDEKLPTREKRIKIREGIKEKLDAVRTEYKNMVGGGIELLRQARKLDCQLNHIPEESVRTARDFFKDLGFPTVVSNGDGERLCSALCREGIAVGVYSSDSDNLVHGAPILIKGVGPKIYDENNYEQATFEIIRVENVLRSLSMDQTMFVDFCIASGCDYNVNMRGIAAVKACNLLKTFGSIDRLPRDKYDITCLNHQSCRELFKMVPHSDLTNDVLNPDPQPYDDGVLEVLRSYGMESRGAEVREIFERSLKIRNFNHPVSIYIMKVNEISMILDEEDGETLHGIRPMTPEQRDSLKISKGARTTHTKSSVKKGKRSQTTETQISPMDAWFPPPGTSEIQEFD